MTTTTTNNNNITIIMIFLQIHFSSIFEILKHEINIRFIWNHFNIV